MLARARKAVRAVSKTETTTEAWVITPERELRLIERPLVSMGPGQVRLDVIQCGLCEGDTAVYRGEVPNAFANGSANFGHEMAAVVTAVGRDVTRFSEGDVVIGWVPGAAMARTIVAHPSWLVLAPEGVRYPAAAGEPLGCCVNAVRKTAAQHLLLNDDPWAEETVIPRGRPSGRLPEGRAVLFVGAGFMNLAAMQLHRLHEPELVIVAARRPEARALALELGATHVVDLTRDDLPTKVRSITGGDLADIVYEGTGVQAGVDFTLSAARMGIDPAVTDELRVGATVAFIGYHQSGNGIRKLNLAHVNVHELGPVNAHFRRVPEIVRGIAIGAELAAEGLVDTDRMVTDVFSFDQVPQAMATAAHRAPGSVKTVVEIRTL